MKEFVAGASGALGAPLVPKLVEAEHQVVAMTRTRRSSIGCRCWPTPRVRGRRDAFQPWLARLAAGEAATVMMTEARGASNAKAKRDVGLRLRYPSWRLGFTEGLG